MYCLRVFLDGTVDLLFGEMHGRYSMDREMCDTIVWKE